VQTKTLVNRTRTKVVNIALTKKLSSFRDAPLGAGPESITTVPATLALNATSVVMDSGLARFARAPE
jgi:hypothetical protein